MYPVTPGTSPRVVSAGQTQTVFACEPPERKTKCAALADEHGAFVILNIEARMFRQRTRSDQDQTIWISVFSNRPSSPNSTPMPELLTPPNGTFGCSGLCLFIHAVPHCSCSASLLGPLHVLRPDRAAQSVRIVVGAVDHLVEVGIADDRQHRAELLFVDQRIAVVDVGDQREPDRTVPLSGALPPRSTRPPAFLAASVRCATLSNCMRFWIGPRRSFR